MKCKKGKYDDGKEDHRRELNDRTIQAYLNLHNDLANKKELTEEQVAPMKKTWKTKANTRPSATPNGHDDDDDLFNKQLNEIQKAAQDIHDMSQYVKMCDVGNIIHAAKLQKDCRSKRRSGETNCETD